MRGVGLGCPGRRLCGQRSERGATAGVSLAPSAVSAAGSRSVSPLTVPGPNYDGTGVWTLQEPCSPDCGLQLDLVQNARGDLTLRICDDCHVAILLRREGGRPKTGAISDYSASMTGLVGDPRECINMQGSAQIDSSSVPNTLAMSLTGQNWHGTACGPESGTGVFQK